MGGFQNGMTAFPENFRHKGSLLFFVIYDQHGGHLLTLSQGQYYFESCALFRTVLSSDLPTVGSYNPFA